MKKLGNLLLVLAILSCLVLPAAAEAPDVPPLEDAIVEACTYGKQLLLTDYNISTQELEEVYQRLYNEGRFPWYVGTDLSYGYNRITETAINLDPPLLDPAVYDRDLYEQKAAEILAECVLPGMTDWQIALSLHDYLVSHSTYDSTLAATTGYDLLIHGTSTCAGYTAAYMDLMNRAGVPCRRVTSIPMEHAWNLVQLDGQWYHADLTWDDPTPNTQGYARHSNFLVSDQDIAEGEKPHHGWETDIKCTSDRFQDAYWRDLTSPVIFESGDSCYLLRYAENVNSLYRRSESAGSEQLLHKNQLVTLQGEENRYTVRHSGLSLRDGRLYFPTLDGVVSVNTQGEDLHREFDYDVETGNHVQGCFASGDTLTVTIANLDTLHQDEQISLPAFSGHVHSYTSQPLAATCTEPGWQLYTCACGISYRSGMTEPAGHSLVREEGRNATFFNGGYTTGTCSVCGLTETETTPRIDFFLWFRENGIIPALVLVACLFLWALVPSRKKKKASVPPSSEDEML